MESNAMDTKYKVEVHADYPDEIVDPERNALFQRLIERRGGVFRWCIARTPGDDDPHNLMLPRNVSLFAEFETPCEGLLFELHEAGFENVNMYEEENERRFTTVDGTGGCVKLHSVLLF
jgi:hypothetical protein